MSNFVGSGNRYRASGEDGSYVEVFEDDGDIGLTVSSWGDVTETVYLDGFDAVLVIQALSALVAAQAGVIA